MKLTSNAIDLIRKQISVSPLQDDELRRIKGMGNLFICSTKLGLEDGDDIERDGWTYWIVYSLRIDEVVYYFFNGSPNSSQRDQRPTR